MGGSYLWKLPNQDLSYVKDGSKILDSNEDQEKGEQSIDTFVLENMPHKPPCIASYI